MSNFIKQIEKINKRLLHLILKLFIKNKKVHPPIDIANIRNILLLRTDRIGDMAVSTPLIRALRKSVPEASIFVFASEVNADLITNDPDISAVFIKKKNIIKTLMQVIRLRKRKIDLLLNLNLNKSLTNAVLSHYAVPKGIKIASEYNNELSNFYNYLITIQRKNEQHMSLLLLKFMNLFDNQGIDHESNLSISINSDVEKNALKLLKSLGLNKNKFLIFNISSIHSNRNTADGFVIEIINGLMDKISEPILLISDPSQRNRLSFIINSVDSDRVIISPAVDLSTLTAIISVCKMVITPDTALVHLACGVNKPVAAFYTRGEKYHNEWQPIGVKFVSIFGRGTAPVSDIEPLYALQKILNLYEEISTL